MKRCVVTVVFTINADSEDTFLELVERNAQLSLQHEPGCYRFDVIRIDERPDVIVLYEIYENHEAFAKHQETTHFLDFDRLSKSLVSKKEAYIGSLSDDSW